jgi:hypothetical protein
VVLLTLLTKILYFTFFSDVEIRELTAQLTAQFPLVLRLSFDVLISFVICVRTMLLFKEVSYHLRDATFPAQYKVIIMFLYHNMYTNRD